MKNAMTINSVLEMAQNLPIQDQEECVYLISRRITEEKRKKIVLEVHKAESEYHSGKAKKSTADAIMKGILMKLFKTEAEYKKTLIEAEKLVEIDPLPETNEADRLELLCLLIENYEKKHYMFDKVSAKDAIEYVIEQKGLKKSDLIPYFGSQSRVSDFFRGARGLSIGIVKKIHDGLGIPYDVLLRAS